MSEYQINNAFFAALAVSGFAIMASTIAEIVVAPMLQSGPTFVAVLGSLF